MFRFLQVSSRNLASVVGHGRGPIATYDPARSLGLKLDQRRAISVSLVQYKQQGKSFDDKDNKSKSIKEQDGTKTKKRGLWQMASDKISNVGSRTRSATNKGINVINSRMDNSMSDKSRLTRGDEGNRPGQKRSKSIKSGNDYGTVSGDKKRPGTGIKASTTNRSSSSSRSNVKKDVAYKQDELNVGKDRSNERFEVRDNLRSSSKTKKNKSTSGKSGEGPADHRAAGSVRHDKDTMRFILDLGDNQVARIDYKLVGKNCIELYHTEVPESLRGRGIGRALARGAFEAASNADLKLKVTCSYLEHFLRQYSHDKYKKLFDL